MIEARTFVGNLEDARTTLTALKAEYMGEYRIHDTIFRNSRTGASLKDDFLRLRHIPKNIWPEKSVILAIKKTNVLEVGKLSDIPVKLQFDTINEAQGHYEKYLKDTYTYDFDFWRNGWQYHLPNGDVVDLEVVADLYPTIEFKSTTPDGISALIRQFGISKTGIITGPSVLAVRGILLNP